MVALGRLTSPRPVGWGLRMVVRLAVESPALTPTEPVHLKLVPSPRVAERRDPEALEPISRIDSNDVSGEHVESFRVSSPKDEPDPIRSPTLAPDGSPP